MKKLLSSILTIPLIMSTLSTNAFAISNASNTNVTIEIEAGGPSISDKDGPLDKDGNLISLTVPSVLPFIFNKNGTTTVPTDWSIKNYDTEDIKVNNIYFEPHNDWNIHQVENNQKPGEFLLDKGHDYKTIEMLIGEKDKNNNVSIGTKEDDNRIKDINMIIEGVDESREDDYSSITLDFKVNRTPFTKASDEYNAFTMHIDFGFNYNSMDKTIFQEATRNMRAIYFDDVDEFGILNNSEAEDLSNSNIKIKGLETSSGEYHIVSSSVIYAPEDSSYLFSDHKNLELVDFGDNFNTSTALTLEGMFINCPKLTTITLNKNFGQKDNIPESGLFGVNNLTPITVINANSIIRSYDFLQDNRNVKFIPKYADGSLLNKTKFQEAISGMTEIYFDKGTINISNNIKLIDLSDEQDESIIGYAINDTEFHVICQGTIYAPEDCTWLFVSNDDCLKIKTISLDNFDTSNTTDMRSMFNFGNYYVNASSPLSELEYINLGDNFDTSKVLDMSSMFNRCVNLKTLNLGDKFDTSKVLGMTQMFANCRSLEQFDDIINKINTSSVDRINSMFYECTNLVNVDLSGFNISNCSNINSLFYNCYNLESIIFGDNWNTSKVTAMDAMFYNCHSLKEIDLSKFNTSKVTGMRNMFNGCSSLTTLDLSTFNTRLIMRNGVNTSPSSDFVGFANNCPNLNIIILNENFGQTNTLPWTNNEYNSEKPEARLFYVESETPTTIINANSVMKNTYKWSLDNRSVTFE